MKKLVSSVWDEQNTYEVRRKYLLIEILATWAGL